MAAPSLTYSLANGATADASQVMQNYNDLLNGITDGTKDLTINALTCNGAVSLKGTVALGDASADDITHTGSLASSIPIKTTNLYDIGSATLGLAGAYFGTGSTQTARIVATGTLASSRTYTLLDAGAAANFVLSEGAATINATKTWNDVQVFKRSAGTETVLTWDTSSQLALGPTALLGTGKYHSAYGSVIGKALTGGAWSIGSNGSGAGYFGSNIFLDSVGQVSAVQSISGYSYVRVESDATGTDRAVSFKAATASQTAGAAVSSASDLLGVTMAGTLILPQYGSGTLTSTSGTITAVSDSRLKTEVSGRPLAGLAEVKRLRPRFYKWKSEVESFGVTDADVHLGFFAQEVGEVIPEALGKPGADGFYGFYDRPVIAALVEAVKELAAKVGA